MAAKLLHSLADDNPDLQKQIGCMTGIFQIFDRQQMVTVYEQERVKHEFECMRVDMIFFLQDMSSNKSSNEKQRISTESSRASFSSSCSSFSSLDKDLRALKQILEAMQAKGLLETGKEEQDSKFVTQPDFDMKPGLPRQQNLQENLAAASRTRASNSMRTYDSPIVIMKPAKLEKETSKYEEEEVPVVELVAAPEQPSPVSVLDSSVYKDDAISQSLSNSTVSSLTSDISRKKLKNIDNLVQKLRRLNSTHDEASTDYIASLCEKNTNPDHRYISEILLASGLLLRDLGSGTAFQLHQSGHPINPELFCVLEQTKASNLQTKLHRKLIFDAVNEILVAKRMKSGKLAKKTITAQKLLKELCSEIEQLQVVEKPECRLADEEEDGLKAILCEDVVRRSGSWTVFDNEVSGMVLDVERLIFKDLVGEIVMGETAGLLQSKIGRRRQLFAK
ncbi:Protein LONGIFOLIA 1 [Linum perenne]